jgi:hypothetical protein
MELRAKWKENSHYSYDHGIYKQNGKKIATIPMIMEFISKMEREFPLFL